MTGDQVQWILVLEDDPVQSAVYEKILRAGRYQTTAIPDPLDFVSSLDSLPVPTAILLDIVLPGMDGIAVLQHLERHPRWCTVPVILMTASPTRDRVGAAQKLPVPPEGFLVKPVDPQGMLQTLRALIACKEPVYVLRSMQRKRLAIKMALSDTVVEIEMSLRASDDACTEYAAKMVEARRELQSLQMAEGQMRDSLPDTHLGLRSRKQELGNIIEYLRNKMNETVADRRKTLQRRQDILVKQKTIRDLERQIHSLALVLQRNKAASAGGWAPAGEPVLLADDPALAPVDSDPQDELGTGTDPLS